MWGDPMDELIEDLERVVAKHTGGRPGIAGFDFLEFQRETDELLYGTDAVEEISQQVRAEAREEECGPRDDVEK